MEENSIASFFVQAGSLRKSTKIRACSHFPTRPLDQRLPFLTNVLYLWWGASGDLHNFIVPSFIILGVRP